MKNQQNQQVTPWYDSNDSNTSNIEKFVQILNKGKDSQKSLVKFTNKLVKSDLKNLHLPKLKIQQQTLEKQSKSDSKNEEHSTSFYIRNFSQIDKSINNKILNRSKNIYFFKQWNKHRSQKQIPTKKPLIICDLNKTSNLQQNDLSPWAKVQLQLNKEKNSFRLKRFNSKRIQLKYKKLNKTQI